VWTFLVDGRSEQYRKDKVEDTKKQELMLEERVYGLRREQYNGFFGGRSGGGVADVAGEEEKE
jgi:hypothetical protein